MYEYIKRTDAITEINRGDLLVGNCAEWAREIIWRTPYADVAPVKHGHWIEVKMPTGVEAFGYNEMMVVGFKCSVCGENVDVSEGHYRYCPYCGATMKVDTTMNNLYRIETLGYGNLPNIDSMGILITNDNFAYVKLHPVKINIRVKDGEAANKGKWLKNWCDAGLIGHLYEECSLCGCSMIDTNTLWDAKFCPRCGAQMEKQTFKR